MPTKSKKTPHPQEKPPLRLSARLERHVSAAGDSRTFSFICSTDTRDRNGRIVVQDWDLAEFEKNPIVLWNHGEGGSWWGDDVEIDEYFPIGRASNTRVENGKLLADITLASEKVNPIAERVYLALLEGVLNAVSVGWRPTDVRYEVHDDVEVVVLSGNKLLEISVVPMPANPDAVRASLCGKVRELAGQSRRDEIGMSSSFLIMVASVIGMTASSSEDAVKARVSELTEFERAVRDLTGTSNATDARAAIIALGASAKKLQTVEAALEVERTERRKIAVAKVLEAGRADGKLTPANEAQMLEAFCGDKSGLSADPDALERFIKVLPKAFNTAHADTPPVKSGGTNSAPEPTEREKKRAAKLGLDPAALAAERVKLLAERAGDNTNDEDEEG